MELFEKYLQLNNSYKHTLTYTFVRTGPFSAINNMILTMAYCLQKKIKFRIYADGFKFFQYNGWNTVFKTEVPQTHNKLFKYINCRTTAILDSNIINRFFLIGHHLYQLFTGRNLSSAAYYETRTFWFSKEKFNVPELGYEGDLRGLCKLLINMVYIFSDEYQTKIKELQSTITLPEDYIGIHIRRGDKVKERDHTDLDVYMKLAESQTDTRNAFIMTDDYTIIEELQDKYKGWNFYTLTFPYERGWVIETSTKDPEQTDREFVKVLASLDIMAKGSLFIGTTSTNPGMFLGMCMEKDSVKYVDAQDWEIL